VHPSILTQPAKNSSSFLTITRKSHVQRQVAAFFCEGIIYPEQEYSQQNYLLSWLYVFYRRVLRFLRSRLFAFIKRVKLLRCKPVTSSISLNNCPRALRVALP
jgi:hypothetical protein